ncbi:MAG: hypothetical protein AUH92_00145 [Acidobacteria bacterium 13_1_40CM_4_69_4]|nr:MAG: hypothetical protein AUH92_00145 [Acidobacteria bacterium 13_1_40CM_4_69_4]
MTHHTVDRDRTGDLLGVREVRDEHSLDVLLGAQLAGRCENQGQGHDEHQRNDCPDLAWHSTLLRKSRDA